MKETAVEDRGGWVNIPVSEEFARRVRRNPESTEPVTMLFFREPGVKACKCWDLCLHRGQLKYFDRTGHHPMCEIHGEGKGE